MDSQRACCQRVLRSVYSVNKSNRSVITLQSSCKPSALYRSAIMIADNYQNNLRFFVELGVHWNSALNCLEHSFVRHFVRRAICLLCSSRARRFVRRVVRPAAFSEHGSRSELLKFESWKIVSIECIRVEGFCAEKRLQNFLINLWSNASPKKSFDTLFQALRVVRSALCMPKMISNSCQCFLLTKQ